MTSFACDVGDGLVAITSGISNFTTGSAFSVWTADLSSISAIDGQSSVKLTWALPNLASGASFRIDNIQISAITAVPEPSTYAVMAGMSVLSCGFLRRRRK